MKYFLCSDIHSGYTPLMKSLDKCKFDINNPEHTLVVLGDIFDRLDETVEVYKFLSSIPKERCILIKGNHEHLYFSLLNKSFPDSYDFSNGTVKTFCQIAGYDYDAEHELYYEAQRCFNWDDEIKPSVKRLWINIRDTVKDNKITKWLKSDQWVNFYEIGNYICVHSFIPLKYHEERGITEDYAIYYNWTQLFEYIPEWRGASYEQWEKATWGCAYKFFDAGLFKEEVEDGKILVCGHYKCSAFNEHYLNLGGHDIYYGKNLIAIDATTALSNQVNVLVIDDDKCYDQNGPLTYKKPCPKIETVTLSSEEYEKYKNDVTNS
jgi:hypothetical protein